MKEYLEKSSKILDELQTTEQGLSEAEAARRLSEHGPNRLAAGKKKSNLQRFFEELKDPMILILLAAALISGITSAYEGESYADVVIILTVVIINAVLGVLQESKAEKAIEALQEIAAATSKVMRGGKMEVKKSEELVPGDIVILEAGDAVPADGRILESASMKIEQAALTGESVPVNKRADVLTSGAASEVPLGDGKHIWHPRLCPGGGGVYGPPGGVGRPYGGSEGISAGQALGYPGYADILPSGRSAAYSESGLSRHAGRSASASSGAEGDLYQHGFGLLLP